MKTKQLVACAAVLSLGLASAASMAAGVRAHPGDPQVSPFTDNITVNLHGTPGMNIEYFNDNGVNFQDSEIPTPPPSRVDAGATSFSFHLHSTNLLENGNPSMMLHLDDGTTCTLHYVDGPWTYLNFEEGNPPQCGHLQVGTITQEDQYQYTLDLTYQQ